VERGPTRWARRTWPGALALALVGACASGGAKPGGTASVGTAPRAQASTTTIDPWAVPAVITVPYVNRVLAELNHIDGNAIRSARAANALTPEFNQLEMSIFATEQNFDLTQQVWQKTIADGWANVSEDPGDVVSTVMQLLSTSSQCIYASVREDFSHQGPGGVGVAPKWWIALSPTRPTTANPTHWAFIYDGYDSSGGAPTNACAGY